MRRSVQYPGPPNVGKRIVRRALVNFARNGESPKQVPARVNRTILGELEAKVLALRALHANLREMDGGPSFGEVVARSRPKSEML